MYNSGIKMLQCFHETGTKIVLKICIKMVLNLVGTFFYEPGDIGNPHRLDLSVEVQRFRMNSTPAAGSVGAGSVPALPLQAWTLSCVLGTQLLGTLQRG